MKHKIKNILKITALFLCIALILPFAAACGEKEPEDDNPATEGAVDTTPAPNENTTPEPTPEPTDPPTTEEPTEPIDPNLPYYEYLDEEFSRFGFTGGEKIIAETEQGITDLIRVKGFCTKSPIEISGEDVPFDSASRYEITELAANMWETAAEVNFASDKTLSEGDIIAGCMYVRDAGGPNPAQLYLAMKTPTNEWGSEGNMSVSLIEPDADGGWQKVYFYGESVCDEDPASTAVFCIFLGYEPHTVEIGGIYMMRYPATDENFQAAEKMPY